jgi:hypothetical protein
MGKFKKAKGGDQPQTGESQGVWIPAPAQELVTANGSMPTGVVLAASAAARSMASFQRCG